MYNANVQKINLIRVIYTFIKSMFGFKN